MKNNTFGGMEAPSPKSGHPRPAPTGPLPVHNRQNPKTLGSPVKSGHPIAMPQPGKSGRPIAMPQPPAGFQVSDRATHRRYTNLPWA